MGIKVTGGDPLVKSGHVGTPWVQLTTRKRPGAIGRHYHFCVVFGPHVPVLCRFGGNCAKPHVTVCVLLCVYVCAHPGPAVQPKYKRSVEHASGLANTGQLWPRGFTPFCACMPLDRSRLVFGGQVSVRCHIGIMRQAPQCVGMCACRCLLSAAAYLQEHS